MRELCIKHGSLREAARVLEIDHAYLYRLGNGEKFRPGGAILRQLGLVEVTLYVRAE